MKAERSRRSLLAGTALGTGVLAALAIALATPTPAEAACANINWDDFASLGFYQIVCGAKITTEVNYNDGLAPTSAADTSFDGDLHLNTLQSPIAGTFIKSPWDGIDIKADGGNGYHVEVVVDSATAIWSRTEVVQVRTTDGSEGDGHITITNNGFLSNQAGGFGSQNGIDGRSQTGDITITNNSYVGVEFIAGLDFVGNQFVDANDSNAPVTLTNGSAFSIPTFSVNELTPTGTGAITGAGIYAFSEGGDITETNFGTVWSVGSGMYASTTGAGTVTMKNYSPTSIHSLNHGMEANADGGTIDIWNGDGVGTNPDGLVVANQDGVHAVNHNAGSIYVHNGNLVGSQTSSNSQIYAWGQYGIYAYTHADPSDFNEDHQAIVDIWNYGLVQLQSESGEAAIHGRSSADADGRVTVFNGGTDMSNVALNARVNAYQFGVDNEGGLIYNAFDADGVQAYKFGGAGNGQFQVTETASGLVLGSYPFGVAALNYGRWDFTGLDNYLTPGFSEGGAVVLSIDQASTIGGIYAPKGSAYRIRHFGTDNTVIWNDGTAIGQGNRWDPVADIRTAFSESGGGTEGDGNFILFYNGINGVIGSAATPYAWDMSLGSFLNVGFGYRNGSAVTADWSFIEQNITSGSLASFGEAAGDRLLHSNYGSMGTVGEGGAPLYAWNQGLMIGQFQTFTDRSSEGGTSINNWGAWFVTGTNRFYGSSNDTLDNWGLVQTAFSANTSETTTFRGLNYIDNYAVISMVDTPVGSTNGYFDVLRTTGQYEGGGSSSEGGSYGLGYLAVDTYFGAYDWTGPAGSDRFYIGGDIGGSTGVIVHKLNTTPGFITDPNGILVISSEGDDLNNFSIGGTYTCYDTWCKAGNTVFISPLSQNYLAINGTGFIQDGIFIHGIQEVGEPPDPDFVFKSAYGPAAADQPGLITGMQSAFYETGGNVEDHEYGNQFPQGGQGGGGADMPYAVQQLGHGGALWGKVTGSLGNASTTVTSAGIPIDTSFHQNIQSLLAGIELRPQGGESGWRLGAFGGGIWSGLTFDSFGGSAKYSGGTIGAYAAYFSGPWYADAEIKADFLGISYSSPAVSASTNGRNLGILANAGYRMESGRTFFEPLASFALLNTSIDPATGGGATVTYSNGTSVRAGIGARVGTTLGNPGDAKVDLDLLGKLWNEFGGPNTITVSDGVNTDTFTNPISGLFGEVVGRATVYSADRMLSGYASVGGKFGSGWQTYTAKAGIRKNF